MPFWRSKFVCKPTLYLLVFISLTGLLVLMDTHDRFHRRRNLVTDPPPPKVILSWTAFFRNKHYLPRSLDGLGCRVDNCVTTSNRSQLEVSDSVIFHWNDIDWKDMPQKVNTRRNWVLFNYEPPLKVDWYKVMAIIGKITWVATYRSDSDIVTPYGQYRQKSSEDELSDIFLTQDEFENKKSVVWLVSNCNTSGKREDFANVLKRHITVDAFGYCGIPAPCQSSNSKNRIFCHQKLAKNYKFYLSFENSLCKDYATEKVFLPLTAGLVPVVFGGANYSRILPPNSFIDALAFQTPKDLADYLLEVGRNFTLYQSYQKWRERYKIVQSDTPDFHWLCDLCRFLHEEEHHASVLDMQSFYDWWFAGGMCSAWKERAPSRITNQNNNLKGGGNDQRRS